MTKPLTRADLLRIAHRYDTAMSRAMLKALCAPSVPPSARIEAEARTAWKYRAMLECMANRRSPMDGLGRG